VSSPQPSSTKTNSEQDLLDVAKQAVAMLCDIEPEDVYVNEKGIIDFSTPTSSAAVFFWVDSDDDEPASYQFRCPLLLNVDDQPLVYSLINEINKDIVYGQIYYCDGDISFYYRLMVDKPSPEMLITVLEYMQEKGDEYDDKLKARLGGGRLIEKEEDEIDV
jgi:hypothetical protein